MQKEDLIQTLKTDATKVGAEGYVKYTCKWIRAQPLSHDQLSQLIEWRQKLYRLNLIGAYPNKIGFGNISVRISNSDSFIISGTETGNIPILTEEHFSVVTRVDIDANTLECTGPIRASSEAMTHAAAYVADPKIMAVIHCHSPAMWKNLLYKLPTTSRHAQYGTPQIARAITKIVKQEKKRPTLIVLGGHEPGLLCAGKDLDEVGNIYTKEYKRLKLSPTRT